MKDHSMPPRPTTRMTLKLLSVPKWLPSSGGSKNASEITGGDVESWKDGARGVSTVKACSAFFRAGQYAECGSGVSCAACSSNVTANELSPLAKASSDC